MELHIPGDSVSINRHLVECHLVASVLAPGEITPTHEDAAEEPRVKEEEIDGEPGLCCGGCGGVCKNHMYLFNDAFNTFLLMVVTLLEVSEKEEGVVALHLPIWVFINPLWVGAGTEM